MSGVADMKKMSGMIAYGLFFMGLSLLMFGVVTNVVWHWPDWIVAFIRDVGLLLSASMAGTIIHEMFLRNEMVREIVDKLDGELTTKVPKLSEITSGTALSVHDLFSRRPPNMTGLRLAEMRRRDFAAYYTWTIETKPQELVFAGRSVLHRIDADIRRRDGRSAEEIIIRRLGEGCKIRIDFLDPRIGILKRLASEEGQPEVDMLGDIAKSIGICRLLGELLQAESSKLPLDAELNIRVYDQVPYFAYHQQDENILVGFYFMSSKGYASAAYEVADDNTKELFSDHFVRIHSEAANETLVQFDGARGRSQFNIELFEKLRVFLKKKLGNDRANELLLGEPAVPGTATALDR